MKILIVNNLYPPYSRGGGETAVVNEAQSLIKLGHEVFVLTTASFQGWRSLKAVESKEDGVRVFRFFPLNLFWYRNDNKHNAFVRALWYIGNFWGWHPVSIFKKVVKTVKPDAIHLHNINGMSYKYPRVCDKLGIPSVFTVHAVHYAVPSGVIVRIKRNPRTFGLFARVLRRKLRSRAVVTAPSQWLLDFYSKRGFFKGQKTAVVPNPLPGLSSAPTTYNLQATTRFLYVGQLEQYKGINVMLALEHLLGDLPWQLSIVGDGTLMADLRRQRDQRVIIRGKLANDAVATAMRSADALIMPSLCEENSPMVIAEALANGLPVIASRIGGIPEMIEDGKNGFLFAPGNAEELSAHCRRIIEHPEILEPMRAAAMKAAGRYDPKRVADEYLKLFK